MNWHMQASWLGRLLSPSWIIPTGLIMQASVSVGVCLIPLKITIALHFYFLNYFNNLQF